MLLGILPMFLMIAAFAASTYVAIDVTAGERERGSIEPLLMAPVAPVLLLLGKLVAVIAFGALGVCAAVLSFTLVARVVPFDDVGVSVHLDVRTVLMLVALTLPVTLTAAATQCLVGVLSKSFKTAQAAISLVIIVPTVPAMLLSVFPQQPKLWMAAIPTLGEPMLALRLLRGDAVDAVHVVVLVVANAAVAGALTLVTARLFGPRLLSSG